jgi:hypothetical protein
LFTENTTRLHYRDQPVDVDYRNNNLPSADKLYLMLHVKAGGTTCTLFGLEGLAGRTLMGTTGSDYPVRMIGQEALYHFPARFREIWNLSQRIDLK